MTDRRDALAEALRHLAITQAEAARTVEGEGYDATSPDAITRYSFAMIGEVFELAQELGWKVWRRQPEVTPAQRARVADEFADVLCFLGTLADATAARYGLSPEDLAKAWRHKVKVNRERFAGRVDGYGTRATTQTPTVVRLDPAPVGGPPARYVTPDNGVRPPTAEAITRGGQPAMCPPALTMPVVPHTPVESLSELEVDERYVLRGSWGYMPARCVHVDNMARVATLKSDGGATYNWVEGGSPWQVLKPTREGVAP
jgi:NTP pyrophosphatase (non-canonical NTP hydrolase)